MSFSTDYSVLVFCSEKHFPQAITFIHQARAGRGGGEKGANASASGPGSFKGSNATTAASAFGASGGVLVHWCVPSLVYNITQACPFDIILAAC